MGCGRRAQAAGQRSRSNVDEVGPDPHRAAGTGRAISGAGVAWPRVCLDPGWARRGDAPRGRDGEGTAGAERVQRGQRARRPPSPGRGRPAGAAEGAPRGRPVPRRPTICASCGARIGQAAGPIRFRGPVAPRLLNRPAMATALAPLPARPSWDLDCLGPYNVLGTIAEGGMGIVLRGQDVRNGRMVALKTVRSHRRSDEAGIRREISVLRQLSHPGIVHLLADGVCAGAPWMALELLYGETVSD